MKPLPNIPLSPIRKENEEVSSNPSITVESNSANTTNGESNSTKTRNVESNSANTGNVESNSTTSDVESNSMNNSNVESNSANTGNVESNSTTSDVESNSMNNSNVESNNTTNVESNSTTSDVESNSMNTGRSDGVIFGAIKLNIENKFLIPEEVFALMLTHRPSGKSVPGGIKENVAFALENESNLNRKGFGKRACYIDDCGAWSRS